MFDLLFWFLLVFLIEFGGCVGFGLVLFGLLGGFGVVSFRCFVVIDCCLDCIAVGILFCYYFGLFNSCGGDSLGLLSGLFVCYLVICY